MEGAVQKGKVGPRFAFGLALAAAAVPGLWVLGPVALYLSRGSGRPAKALSCLACAELAAFILVLLIKGLGRA